MRYAPDAPRRYFSALRHTFDASLCFASLDAHCYAYAATMMQMPLMLYAIATRLSASRLPLVADVAPLKEAIFYFFDALRATPLPYEIFLR